MHCFIKIIGQNSNGLPADQWLWSQTFNHLPLIVVALNPIRDRILFVTKLSSWLKSGPT